MSNKSDLETKLQEIEAITGNEIRKPDMPIDKFMQEAEDLNHTAIEDKDKLIARGLNISVINNLPMAIGACREAETRWFNERYEKQAAEKVWKENSPMAYELRNDLIDEFEYAFRDDSALLSRVNEIKEDKGHADMIQDLNNLAGLGKRNISSLQEINCDVNLLEVAAETSDTMAQLLARANGDKGETNGAKILRDQAYTYLKRNVDEIKQCGKFVFRKDKEHLKKYRSHYYNHH